MSDSLSRRNFIKTASLALPLVAGVEGGRAASPPPSAAPIAPSPSPAPRHYPGKQTRLTISMWDFSWLCAHHKGGAYEDLERRVAEAAERGYNTLRVDCFPSRVLEKESTFKKNWDPALNIPKWGQTAVTFTCDVRAKVRQLADLCRKHGIWLGLDSWDKAHMFGHANPIAPADEEREFTRYGQTWVRALKLLREDGVLERAVWVAPMNEVPHYGSRYVVSLMAGKQRPLNEGETTLKKKEPEDAIYRRLNHWMGAPIKAEIERDKIPLSYSSLKAERYANRLTDLYDVVDIHFMPVVITGKEDEAALARAYPDGQYQPFIRFAEYEKMDLKVFSRAWDRACRKNYRQMLERTRT